VPPRSRRGIAARARLRLERDRAVGAAHPDRSHRTVAAPLELLGKADHPGEESQPLSVAVLLEVAQLRGIGVALAVIAGDQPDQHQLPRREAGQAGIKDQVVGVAMVVVVVDRGADVVQQTGRP